MKQPCIAASDDVSARYGFTMRSADPVVKEMYRQIREQGDHPAPAYDLEPLWAAGGKRRGLSPRGWLRREAALVERLAGIEGLPPGVAVSGGGGPKGGPVLASYRVAKAYAAAMAEVPRLSVRRARSLVSTASYHRGGCYVEELSLDAFDFHRGAVDQRFRMGNRMIVALDNVRLMGVTPCCWWQTIYLTVEDVARRSQGGTHAAERDASTVHRRGEEYRREFVPDHEVAPRRCDLCTLRAEALGHRKFWA